MTTTAYQIGITWQDGDYNGGTPILDYRVWYKLQSSSDPFSLFSDTVPTAEVVVTGPTAGTMYQIYVESRNLIGYSPVSETVAILAAQIPDAPTSLANQQTITSASQIGLTWAPPVFNGGSSVIDYRVWCDNASSGTSFTVVQAGIVSASYTATGLTKGKTYQFKV